MNINFPNKKIPFKIVIIVLLIFIGVIGAIFYWQKTRIPPVPPDTSPEPVKAECLEETSEMTVQELINEVKALEFIDEISIPVVEERLTYAYKNMINYLICEADYDRNEESYNRAKDYIEGLTYTNEENKESALNRLDNTYSRSTVEDSFTLQLALMDLGEICPNILVNLCIEEANQFPEEKKENDIEKCKDICNLINQYYEDEDKLETEIINNQSWFDNELLYNQKQYRYRVAMTYRLKGRDLASRVCDNIDNSEKENCIEWINIIDKQDEKTEKCNNILKELEELICRLPANEIE